MMQASIFGILQISIRKTNENRRDQLIYIDFNRNFLTYLKEKKLVLYLKYTMFTFYILSNSLRL